MNVLILAWMLAGPGAQLEIGQPQQAHGPRFLGLTGLDALIDPRIQRRVGEDLYQILGLRPQDRSDIERWQDSLNRCEESFRQGRMEAAIEMLSALVLTLKDEGVAWKRSVDLLAQALLLQGRIFLHQGDEDGAVQAFRAHLSLRPHRPPDPALYRPQVISFYEERALIPMGQHRLALELLTEPPGLSVWLNGQRLGSSPLTIPALVPGRHLLRVEGDMAIHQQVLHLAEKPQRQTHRVILAGQDKGVASVLAAWRQKQGLAPVVEAILALKDPSEGAWMAGLAPGAQGILLHLARFDGQGQLVGLESLELAADLANLGHVLKRASTFPSRGGEPVKAQEQALVFGEPVETQRRPWTLIAVTATAVSAVALGVSLALANRDEGGIRIDPTELQ